MSASGHNVKLEFVGGPYDGTVHVVREPRFAVGATEDAEISCANERLLSGGNQLLFEFDDAGNLSVSSTAEMQVDGVTTHSSPRLAEGAIVRVGATEIQVAEIAALEGGTTAEVPKRTAARTSAQVTSDATVTCKNPECGEVNEAGRVWCKKCGRDL